MGGKRGQNSKQGFFLSVLQCEDAEPFLLTTMMLFHNPDKLLPVRSSLVLPWCCGPHSCLANCTPILSYAVTWIFGGGFSFFLSFF